MTFLLRALMCVGVPILTSNMAYSEEIPFALDSIHLRLVMLSRRLARPSSVSFVLDCVHLEIILPLQMHSCSSFTLATSDFLGIGSAISSQSLACLEAMPLVQGATSFKSS